MSKNYLLAMSRVATVSFFSVALMQVVLILAVSGQFVFAQTVISPNVSQELGEGQKVFANTAFSSEGNAGSLQTTLAETSESKNDFSLLEDRIQKLESDLAARDHKESEKKAKELKHPSFKPFGRVHINSGYFTGDDIIVEKAGDPTDGINMRRARIGASGKYLDQYGYKLEVDFASGGNVAIKDVYGEMTKLPILSDIRIGHFKESISPELLASENNTWFIERSVVHNSTGNYIGDRSLGLTVGNGSQKKNWLWNVGIYRPTSDKQVSYQNDNDGYQCVSRIASLLYDDEETGRRLHLGLGYGFYSRDEKTSMKLDATLENSLCGSLVSTENFDGTNSYHAFVPELIWTHGALALHSELYLVQLNNDKIGDHNFTGGSCQLGYWLTGEFFNYEKGKGILGGTDPQENFIRKCEDNSLKTGWGGWMLAYRFAWIDLDWKPVTKAGKLYTHTIGLNWQLNSYSRMLFNYNLADARYSTDHSQGTVNGFGSMFQFFF